MKYNGTSFNVEWVLSFKSAGEFVNSISNRHLFKTSENRELHLKTVWEIIHANNRRHAEQREES